MKVNLVGKQQLMLVLNQLPGIVQDAIREGVQLACIEVEESAKRKCPKDSNALRQSIGYKVDNDGDGRIQGIVGSDLDYAVYVHEGTGIHSRTGNGRKDVPWSYCDEDGEWHQTDGIEPTPFLEDARNEKEQRINKILEATLRDALGG